MFPLSATTVFMVRSCSRTVAISASDPTTSVLLGKKLERQRCSHSFLLVFPDRLPHAGPEDEARRGDVLGRKPKLGHDLFRRCRCAKLISADHCAIQASEGLPAHGACSLHGDAFSMSRRDHRVLILRALLAEEFPTRHAHHACLYSQLLQALMCLYAKVHLGAGANELYLE